MKVIGSVKGDQPTNGVRGDIGIVIPAYGHPRFLAEAIESACLQDIECSVPIVVVDDGCRYEETAEVVRRMQSLYPDRVYYIRQPNSRLPAARNRGVKFLLARFPGLDSIFFLDADNRLSPWSLGRYRDALGDDHDVGWAYPDVGFFGMTRDENGFEVCETAPHYSILKHLFANISEAGSLVRADLFRAGIFYNESMRSGFEDWDFWLSCLDGGWRGVRAFNSGFQYRRRPESMLADAGRQTDPLVQKIRQQHPKLYSRLNVLDLLHNEAPPFAVLLSDEEKVLLFLDPADPQVMQKEEWLSLCSQRLSRPAEVFFPEKILIMSEAVWAALTEQSASLHNLFWLIWRRQDGLFLLSGRTGDEKALVISKNLFLDQMSRQSPDLHFGKCKPITLSYLGNVPGVADDHWLETLSVWVKPVVKPREWSRHVDRRYTGKAADEIVKMAKDELLECADGRSIFPMKLRRDSVVIACPEDLGVVKGAAEKVRDIAGFYKSNGSSIILILERKPSDTELSFDSSLWSLADCVIPVSPMERVGGELQYLGYDVQLKLNAPSKTSLAPLVGLGSIFVTVPNAASLELLGFARHEGAQTLVLAHTAFMSCGCGQDDLVARLLGFEHSISRIHTDSRDLKTRLHSEGIPGEKIELDINGQMMPFPLQNSAIRAPLEWRPARGFVFIVTYGRSGSTMLQRLVQLDPDCCFRGENLNMLEALQDLCDRAATLKHHVPLAGDRGPQGPWYGAATMHDDLFTRQLLDLFIHHVLQPSTHHSRVGFKEIRYAELTEDRLLSLLTFMRDYFAPAKFIFNTRNHNDVVRSSWWRDMDETEVRGKLERTERGFQKFVENNPEQCLKVSYDEYVANPDCLRSVFEFLDMPYDPEQVALILRERLTH